MTTRPDGLFAACRHCAALVAIRVAGPESPCTHCGEASPLAEEVSASIERLRTDLLRHRAGAQQLAGKERMLGHSGAVAALVAMATLWLFLGLILWFTPAPLPQGLGLRQFLFEPAYRASGEIAGPVIVRWWLLFTIACGLSLNLFLWAGYRLRVARVASTTWPRPPAASGLPPRCRCCSADLPQEGSVRRCPCCSAEHVVLGERYQRHQASLAAALAALRAQVSQTLADRERSLQRLGSFTLFAPLALLPLFAGALFAPATYPTLWVAPLAALAMAVALVLFGAAMAAPRVRVLDELHPGDGLLVAGKRYEVHGRTATLKPGSGSLSVYFLGAPADASELAIVIALREEGFEGQTYACQRGGAPWSAHPDGGATLEKLVTTPASPLRGRSSIAVEAAGGEPGPLRLWATRPREGDVPELTLVPERIVWEPDLVMIARDA